jgi:Cysteine-rich CPXCG
MADDAEFERAGLNDYHSYSCQFCGEENEVFIDGSMAGSGGQRYQFTEDCAICCRPNFLTVFVDRDGEVFVDVDREYDA